MPNVLLVLWCAECSVEFVVHGSETHTAVAVSCAGLRNVDCGPPSTYDGRRPLSSTRSGNVQGPCSSLFSPASPLSVVRDVAYLTARQSRRGRSRDATSCSSPRLELSEDYERTAKLY
jgi:hypothetical protein